MQIHHEAGLHAVLDLLLCLLFCRPSTLSSCPVGWTRLYLFSLSDGMRYLELQQVACLVTLGSSITDSRFHQCLSRTFIEESDIQR
jgi:hypothetical protein